MEIHLASGDVPLISKDTLHSLIVKHEINNYDATMLTAEINNPTDTEESFVITKIT